MVVVVMMVDMGVHSDADKLLLKVNSHHKLCDRAEIVINYLSTPAI